MVLKLIILISVRFFGRSKRTKILSYEPFQGDGNSYLTPADQYIEGAGGPYYSIPSDYYGGSYGGRGLVYLKKGDIEIGTPYESTLFYTNTENQTTENQTVGSEHHYRLFPNPVRDIFTIESSEGVRMASIEIFDLSGKLITARDHVQGSSELFYFDAPAGVYFCHMKTDKGFKEVIRFLKL